MKYDSKIKRLIQNAHLPESQAYIDGIKYYSDCGLNRDLIHELSTNKYITAPHNVIIVGPTGSGKSYIACALGYESCLGSIRSIYVRLPDLLTEIALAKAEATFSKLLKRYECFDLLIIDKWGLMAISTVQAEELFDIIERRNRTKATIYITSF